MSTGNPRSARRPFTSGRTHEVVDPKEANATRDSTLLRNSLKRRARALGFELRHSSYGYSLVDANKQRVDDRNDLTLKDVKKHLDKI